MDLHKEMRNVNVPVDLGCKLAASTHSLAKLVWVILVLVSGSGVDMLSRRCAMDGIGGGGVDDNTG